MSVMVLPIGILAILFLVLLLVGVFALVAKLAGGNSESPSPEGAVPMRKPESVTADAKVEQRRILQMVQEGKISADEAQELLTALTEGKRSPTKTTGSETCPYCAETISPGSDECPECHSNLRRGGRRSSGLPDRTGPATPGSLSKCLAYYLIVVSLVLAFLGILFIPRSLSGFGMNRRQAVWNAPYGNQSFNNVTVYPTAPPVGMVTGPFSGAAVPMAHPYHPWFHIVVLLPVRLFFVLLGLFSGMAILKGRPGGWTGGLIWSLLQVVTISFGALVLNKVLLFFGFSFAFNGFGIGVNVLAVVLTILFAVAKKRDVDHVNV